MKKIVLFYDSIKNWWWVEKIQSDLSIWLNNIGYDVTHLLMEDKTPRNDFWWKIHVFNEKFIYWFWFKKIVSLFKISYEVNKYCMENKVDIIVWQWDFFYMAVSLSKILFKNKSKCIWVPHLTLNTLPFFIKKILIILLKKLDIVVFISKEEMWKFINNYNFPQNKTKFITNCINENDILIKINEELDPEDTDILKNGKYTFINIWRLESQKWQERLLLWFDLLNRKYNNTQLIILWDWNEKDKLLKLRNSLQSKEDIYLLWNKKNVYKYLSKSNCFVFSSFFEWLPLVLLETMVCKIPIISTNCPTWPLEILNWIYCDNKITITDNWILVPYNNSTEQFLFEAMEKIYLDNNLSNKIIQNNLKNLERYSYWKYINSRDNFLKEL